MQTTLGNEARNALFCLASFKCSYAQVANGVIEEWKTGSSRYSEETILALHDGAYVLQKSFEELWERIFVPLLEGNSETHADHLYKFINAPVEIAEEFCIEE